MITIPALNYLVSNGNRFYSQNRALRTVIISFTVILVKEYTQEE